MEYGIDPGGISMLLENKAQSGLLVKILKLHIDLIVVTRIIPLTVGSFSGRAAKV